MLLMDKDKERSKPLTFNSQFVRYSFCRLLYGIHSASEIFQAQIAKTKEGIEGTKKRRYINLVGHAGRLHCEIKEKSSADYVKMV